jgi:tellurite resistance protein
VGSVPANLTGRVDQFAGLLLYFELFLFVVLAPSVPFGASWWAISFPLAALVNAALKYASVHPALLLKLLAGGLLVVLTAALLVLTLRARCTFFSMGGCWRVDLDLFGFP